MFRPIDKHPPDHVLLSAADGTLSRRRAAAVEVHLRRCDDCRARIAALIDVRQDAIQVILNDDARPGLRADARDRLRAQMAVEAASWKRSPWFRLRRAAGTVPPVVRIAVAATVAILMLQIAWLASVMRQTQTPAEIEAAALPLPTLTPGAVGPVKLEDLCAGRTVERPPVPASVRDIVLREYRMERVADRDYELDYLITPELGGVPDARNLWPERYATKVWNARVKDQLEDLLPQLICRRQVDLATAQHDIAGNWIAAYKKYFRTDHPLASERDDHGTVGEMLINGPVELVAARTTTRPLR